MTYYCYDYKCYACVSFVDNCACGMDDSCVKPGTKCNCDMNDDILREDSGYITDMIDLPITQFLAGDTGCC